MFRGGHPTDDINGEMHTKSYEEILEEYEKFFSLDQETLHKTKSQSSAASAATVDASLSSLGIGEVKGGNIVLEIPIDFAQSVAGATRTVSYDRILICEACEGKRVSQVSEDLVCPKCHGSGDSAASPGDVCPACHGAGLASVECPACRGDGITKQRARLSVKIPKSVDNDMLLRVRDRGHQALNGKSGDLILQIAILPHERFSRKGFNIHSALNITITQAALGGNIDVDTINGKINMKIQPGTAHDQQYMIKGFGFEKLGKE